MNGDRKRLARKVNDEFFLPGKEKAPVQPSSSNEEMTRLIRMLNASPELIAPMLQMAQIMGAKIN